MPNRADGQCQLFGAPCAVCRTSSASLELEKSERSKRAREWGCVRTIAVFARELSAETRARPADVQPSPSPVRKRKTSQPKDDFSGAAVARIELQTAGS